MERLFGARLLKERWPPAATGHAQSKGSRLAAFSCISHG